MFSFVALVLIAGGTLAYLWAAYRQRRTPEGWSGGRVCALGVGAAVLATAVSPPLVSWAHQDLQGHMVQHLLVGMVAPIGLVLSAPVTLTLRTVSVPAARRLTALLRSGPGFVLTHPVTALFLNTGGMYVLYATPLYALSLQSSMLSVLVHVHFLGAGTLFCWAILAGPDPAPHPTSPSLRLIVLVVSMAAHAILGKVMYGALWPSGTPHGVEEIRAAAQLMYYGGDGAEVMLAIAFFWRWYRAPASHRDEFLSGLLRHPLGH